MAAEAAQAKPQFEGADAAAQAVHAAKPADALTTVLGPPAGSTPARRARLDSTDLLLGLARRNWPARRLAAAQLSEAINASGRKASRRTSAVARLRSSAPRRDARNEYAGGRPPPAGRRPSPSAGTRVPRATRCSRHRGWLGDAAARPATGAVLYNPMANILTQRLSAARDSGDFLVSFAE